MPLKFLCQQVLFSHCYRWIIYFISSRPGDTIIIFISLCRNVRCALKYLNCDPKRSPLFPCLAPSPLLSSITSFPTFSFSIMSVLGPLHCVCDSCQMHFPLLFMGFIHLLPDPLADVIVSTRCLCHCLLHSQSSFQVQNNAFKIKEWMKISSISLFSKSAAWATFSSCDCKTSGPSDIVVSEGNSSCCCRDLLNSQDAWYKFISQSRPSSVQAFLAFHIVIQEPRQGEVTKSCRKILQLFLQQILIYVSPGYPNSNKSGEAELNINRVFSPLFCLCCGTSSSFHYHKYVLLIHFSIHSVIQMYFRHIGYGNITVLASVFLVFTEETDVNQFITQDKFTYKLYYVLAGNIIGYSDGLKGEHQAHWWVREVVLSRDNWTRCEGSWRFYSGKLCLKDCQG